MDEAQILLDFDDALTAAEADLCHLREPGGDLGTQLARPPKFTGH